MDETTRRRVGVLGRVVCFVGAVAVMAGVVGGATWLTDLCAHFVLPQAVILLVGMVLAAQHPGWTRSEAVGPLVALLVAGGRLGEVWVPTSAEATPWLTVSSVNVRLENTEHRRLTDWLARIRPDVACLVEVDQGWARSLDELAQMTEAHMEARGDFYGTSVFVSDGVEVLSAQTLAARRPVTEATLRKDGVTFKVLALHAPPPLFPELGEARDTLLTWVGSWVRQQEVPTIVCGDLNATRWSGVLRALLGLGVVQDPRAGRGMHATWPAGWSPVKLPIDHVLPSVHWGVSSVEVGASVGSDHLPLTVVLGRPR